VEDISGSGPPKSKYMPSNPSFSYITPKVDAVNNKQLNLVQTKTKCWWGYTCAGDAANSEAVCTERCNCVFTGNQSLGYNGCTDRDYAEALTIYNEHCQNYGTMGPCVEAEGTEDTYSTLTSGKYPTLTEVNAYNYQTAKSDSESTNDYSSTVSATGANDQYPDEWELTCSYPSNCPVFDFTKFDTAIEHSSTPRYGPDFTIIAGDLNGPGKGWAAGWDLKINDVIPDCTGYQTNGPYTMPDVSMRLETLISSTGTSCTTDGSTSECGTGEVCSGDLSSDGSLSCIGFQSGQTVDCSSDSDCFYGVCDSGLSKCVYEFCKMADTSDANEDTWGTAADSKTTDGGYFVGGSDASDLPVTAAADGTTTYNPYTDFGGQDYEGDSRLSQPLATNFLLAATYRGYHTHGWCGQAFQSPTESIYMIATFSDTTAPDTHTTYNGFTFDWYCAPCNDATLTSRADVTDKKECPGLAKTVYDDSTKAKRAAKKAAKSSNQ